MEHVFHTDIVDRGVNVKVSELGSEDASVKTLLLDETAGAA